MDSWHKNVVNVRPEKLFFGLLHNCLNCDSTVKVTYSFQLVMVGYMFRRGGGGVHPKGVPFLWSLYLYEQVGFD